MAEAPETMDVKWNVKKGLGELRYELQVAGEKFTIYFDLDQGRMLLKRGSTILSEGNVRTLNTINNFYRVIYHLTNIGKDKALRDKLKKVLTEIRGDAFTRFKAQEQVLEGKFIPRLELELPPYIHGAGDIYVDTDGTIYVFEPIVVPGEVVYDGSQFTARGLIMLVVIHKPSGEVVHDLIPLNKSIEVNGKAFILNPYVPYPDENIIWAEKDVIKKLKEGYRVDPYELMVKVKTAIKKRVDQHETYYTIDALYVMFTYYAKDLFEIAPQIAKRGLSEAGKSISVSSTGILSYHAYIGSPTVAAVRRMVHFYKATPFIDEMRKIEHDPEWKTFILLCHNKMTAKYSIASKEDESKSITYNIYTPIVYVDFHESLERAIESRAIPMYLVRSKKEEYLLQIPWYLRYYEEVKDIITDLYLFRLQYVPQIIKAQEIVEELNKKKWKIKGRIWNIMYPLLVIAYVVDGMQEGKTVEEVVEFARHLENIRSEAERQSDEAIVIDAIKTIWEEGRAKTSYINDITYIPLRDITDEIRKKFLLLESSREEEGKETVVRRASREAERWTTWRVGRTLRNLLGPDADKLITKISGDKALIVNEEIINSLEDRLYAGILPRPKSKEERETKAEGDGE